MFGWVKKNWKTLAVLAVSTVVFVGVTVATGGLGAPALVALAAGGFSSGVAGYVTGQLLDGKPVNAKDAVIQGGIAAGVTVATLGIGRVLAPVLRPVAARVAPVVSRVVPAGAGRVLPPVVRRAATNAALGGTLGGLFKAGENVVRGRPVTDGVGDAITLNAINGVAMGPLVTRMQGMRRPTPPETPATTPSATQGGSRGGPGVAQGGPSQTQSKGIARLLEEGGGDGPPTRPGAEPTGTAKPTTSTQPNGATTNPPPPSRGPPRGLGDDAIDPNVASATTLGGSANKVYKVRFADGSEAIVKGESFSARMTGKMLGISSQNRAEVAAFRIDQQMGLGMVPGTRLGTYQNRPVVIQDFMPGKPPGSLKGNPILESPQYKAQLADMKAFDYLIRNVDRHKGNLLVDPATGKITLIDNGLSHASWRPFYRPSGVFLPKEVSRSFVDKLGNLNAQSLNDELVQSGLLGQREVDAMLARANEILAGVRSGKIRVIDGH